MWQITCTKDDGSAIMGSVERPVKRLWAVPDPTWKFCGPSAATVLAGLPQQAPIHDCAFSTGRQSRTDYSFFCTKHVRGRVPVTDCPMCYRARRLFRSEKAESRIKSKVAKAAFPGIHTIRLVAMQMEKLRFPKSSLIAYHKPRQNLLLLLSAEVHRKFRICGVNPGWL